VSRIATVNDRLYAPVVAGLATGIVFIVVMASAIEIPLRSPSDFIGFANELEQTNVFLRQYPNATITVYPASCTPLTECAGSIVEYTYEDSTNFAIFRIVIQPSERVVTGMQLDCRYLDNKREILTLYGSSLEIPDMIAYLKLERCPDAAPRLQSVFK